MGAKKKTDFEEILETLEPGPRIQVLAWVPIELKRKVQKKLKEDGITFTQFVKASMIYYLNGKGGK